jgi:hypothetical protein
MKMVSKTSLGEPVWTHLDWFLALNSGLFLVMLVVRYYDRFVELRGAAYIHEFFIYAVIILAGIGVFWRYFRHCHFPTALLLAIEIGILMHFAGAFVYIDHQRLYAHLFFGIRYDKYVHCTNAFVGAWLAWHLFQLRGIPLDGLNIFIVLLTVLGVGTCIEIAEYLVSKTVAHNGVGGYDNNLQDLIANGCGGALALAIRRALAHHRNG